MIRLLVTGNTGVFKSLVGGGTLSFELIYIRPRDTYHRSRSVLCRYQDIERHAREGSGRRFGSMLYDTVARVCRTLLCIRKHGDPDIDLQHRAAENPFAPTTEAKRVTKLRRSMPITFAIASA